MRAFILMAAALLLALPAFATDHTVNLDPEARTPTLYDATADDSEKIEFKWEHGSGDTLDVFSYCIIVELEDGLEWESPGTTLHPNDWFSDDPDGVCTTSGPQGTVDLDSLICVNYCPTAPGFNGADCTLGRWTEDEDCIGRTEEGSPGMFKVGIDEDYTWGGNGTYYRDVTVYTGPSVGGYHPKLYFCCNDDDVTCNGGSGYWYEQYYDEGTSVTIKIVITEEDKGGGESPVNTEISWGSIKKSMADEQFDAYAKQVLGYDAPSHVRTFEDLLYEVVSQ